MAHSRAGLTWMSRGGSSGSERRHEQTFEPFRKDDLQLDVRKPAFRCSGHRLSAPATRDRSFTAQEEAHHLS